MRRKPKRKWSARVTKESHALALEPGVFSKREPRQIALSLKRSAEKSKARKGTTYQSAISMLNFYINRAGRNLKAGRKKTLKEAKRELRKIYRK